MKIQGNQPGIGFLNHLNSTDDKIGKLTKSLSSGKRINSFADDAAGGAVSKKLEALFKQYNQEISNLSDDVSMNQVKEGGYSQIADNLSEIRKLQVQAKNDTLNDEDRQAIQKQVDSLVENTSDVISNTEFNTKKVISPGEKLSGAIANGIEAQGSMENTDKIIEEVSSQMSDIGADVNALNAQIDQKSIAFENTVAAYSGISDVDFAKGIVDLTKNQLLELGPLSSIRQYYKLNTDRVTTLLQDL